MALFTVFGSPISHSLSPQIHQWFAEEFGLLNDYQRQLSSPGKFPQHVAEFFRRGGSGANVTVPFKQQAYQLATHTTQRARQAGAVNTLINMGAGQLLGDNTDGYGLCRDLKRHLGSVADRRLLILGAGGAVRGVLGPLLDEAVSQITIVNRTQTNAELLVSEFNDPRITASSFSALERTTADFDVIIQATSVALQTGQELQLPTALAQSAKFCYDLSYAAEPTPFLQWAAQHQLPAADGLGMLVEQAALSFALWHDGLLPTTEPVLAHLRNQLSRQ